MGTLFCIALPAGGHRGDATGVNPAGRVRAGEHRRPQTTGLACRLQRWELPRSVLRVATPHAVGARRRPLASVDSVGLGGPDGPGGFLSAVVRSLAHAAAPDGEKGIADSWDEDDQDRQQDVAVPRDLGDDGHQVRSLPQFVSISSTCGRVALPIHLAVVSLAELAAGDRRQERSDQDQRQRDQATGR